MTKTHISRQEIKDKDGNPFTLYGATVKNVTYKSRSLEAVAEFIFQSERREPVKHTSDPSSELSRRCINYPNAWLNARL